MSRQSEFPLLFAQVDHRSRRGQVFGILPERDVTGDEARAFIQERLGVASLAEASKGAVSRLIDELIAQKGNGSGGDPHSPQVA